MLSSCCCLGMVLSGAGKPPDPGKPYIAAPAVSVVVPGRCLPFLWLLLLFLCWFVFVRLGVEEDMLMVVLVKWFVEEVTFLMFLRFCLSKFCCLIISSGEASVDV